MRHYMCKFLFNLQLPNTLSGSGIVSQRCGKSINKCGAHHPLNYSFRSAIRLGFRFHSAQLWFSNIYPKSYKYLAIYLGKTVMMAHSSWYCRSKMATHIYATMQVIVHLYTPVLCRHTEACLEYVCICWYVM